MSVDFKVIKSKKVDPETNMRVLRNDALSRIAVEFSSDTTKLKVQKSFQDTFQGRLDAEKFQKSIRSTKDLKSYFGIKE
jgi:ribosomal protein S13